MTRMRITAAIVVTAGMVGGLLSGCSSSSKPTASSTTPISTVATTPAQTTSAASSSSSGGIATGACKYLTVDQAAALAKSPVKPGVHHDVASGPVTFDYCDYIFDPGNAPGVTVGVATLTGDGATLFEMFRASEQSETDYQVVPGVGDAAFFAGTNLNVLKGNKGFVLYVGRANGTSGGADALPDLKALANIVLAQA